MNKTPVYTIKVEGRGLPTRYLVRTESGTNVGKGSPVLYTYATAEKVLKFWDKKVNCSHLTFTLCVANREFWM